MAAAWQWRPTLWTDLYLKKMGFRIMVLHQEYIPQDQESVFLALAEAETGK